MKGGKVEILVNDQGNRITPSYVAFTDEERLVGDAAKNQCRFFQRSLSARSGRSLMCAQTLRTLNGLYMISSMCRILILRKYDSSNQR